MLVIAGLFLTPSLVAAQCAKAPVQDSSQAMCYAVAYAERHRLSHGNAFKRTIAKGQNRWTVRFLNDREGARERGWEVDIDVKSGSVTRFLSYRPVAATKVSKS
jgi:hypothetical protein